MALKKNMIEIAWFPVFTKKFRDKNQQAYLIRLRTLLNST